MKLSSDATAPPFPEPNDLLVPPFSCAESSISAMSFDKNIKKQNSETNFNFLRSSTPMRTLEVPSKTAPPASTDSPVDTFDALRSSAHVHGQLATIPSHKNVTLNVNRRLQYDECDPQLDRTQFLCRLCGLAFGFVHELMQHLDCHDKLLKCDFCDCTFYEMEVLAAHKLEIHQKSWTNFNCNNCSKEFEWHHLICNSCERLFFTETTLPRCQHTSPSNDKLICCICQNAFTDESRTRSPDQCNMQEESPSLKRFVLNEGPKDSKKKRVLNRRPRVVHSRKLSTEYACDSCAQVFTGNLALKRHIRKEHTSSSHKIRPNHPCPTCGRIFKKLPDLKTHQNIHTGERPYVCEICGKAFAANPNLIVHRHAHLNRRPFKCDFCDKQFLRKTDRKVHHRTHTGEKAFRCDFCQRAFSKRVYLLAHMQQVHTPAPQHSLAQQKNNTMTPIVNTHDQYEQVLDNVDLDES